MTPSTPDIRMMPQFRYQTPPEPTAVSSVEEIGSATLPDRTFGNARNGQDDPEAGVHDQRAGHGEREDHRLGKNPA